MLVRVDPDDPSDMVTLVRAGHAGQPSNHPSQVFLQFYELLREIYKVTMF